MKKDQIESEAMHLPQDQRAELARKLLLSLEEDSEQDIQDDWVLEAMKRVEQLDRGDVEPVSADVVKEKAKGLLR